MQLGVGITALTKALAKNGVTDADELVVGNGAPH